MWAPKGIGGAPLETITQICSDGLGSTKGPTSTSVNKFTVFVEGMGPTKGPNYIKSPSDKGLDKQSGSVIPEVFREGS